MAQPPRYPPPPPGPPQGAQQPEGPPTYWGPPPPGKPPRRQGALIATLVACIALTGLAILVVLDRGDDNDNSTDDAPTQQGDDPTPSPSGDDADTPAAVVAQYLEAFGNGDRETAEGLTCSNAPDDAILTLPEEIDRAATNGDIGQGWQVDSFDFEVGETRDAEEVDSIWGDVQEVDANSTQVMTREAETWTVVRHWSILLVQEDQTGDEWKVCSMEITVESEETT